ncbi:MAG: homoserine kinase [Actinomycetota bacterium]
MPEALSVTAPATSANLGPGFDVLAVALDLANEVRVLRRPGPLAVRVVGEGAGDVPEDATNLVCVALADGLGSLDGLEVECRNRIPFGRGLGSSAAAVCAGLVAANAIGGLRWSPADLLARAAALEGHADNAAACLEGGIVAVTPGPRAQRIATPRDLAFVTVVPSVRVSTDEARRALPERVPLADASDTLGCAVGLALALAEGRLDDLPDLLHDRLHEPYRAPLVPGIEAVRGLVDGDGCLGVTISGSGPSILVWTRVDAAAAVAERARDALRADGVQAEVTVARVAPAGVRARWTNVAPGRLERSIG